MKIGTDENKAIYSKKYWKYTKDDLSWMFALKK